MRRHARKAPVGGGIAVTDADLRLRVERALTSLFLVYQPVVGWTGESRVIGYEALARCHERGLENPATLFHVAARLGLARDLGRRVRILAHAALMELPADILLFVNLHPAELTDPTLFARDSLLASRAERIVFELTETWPPAGLRSAARRLRARGYGVALDDLGAGHNGLTALAATTPDFAKLDLSLVRGCEIDPRRQRVIRSILALCRDFGVVAVCEGVETRSELATLVGLGGCYFQGYYFGRPEVRPKRPRPEPDA